MARNIKALNPDELEYLTMKYIFELSGDYIITSCLGYDRKVLHSVNEGFSINTPIRRISISKEAIDMWRNYYREFNLIEVQNAINTLILTYQEVNVEEVGVQLQRKDAYIKII